MVRLRGHVYNYDVRLDIYSVHWAIGFEHVRPRSKTVGLERNSFQDSGPQSKAGEETEKHQQSRRKTSQEISATSKEIALSLPPRLSIGELSDDRFVSGIVAEVQAWGRCISHSSLGVSLNGRMRQ